MLEGSAPGSLRATKADEPEMEKMVSVCVRGTHQHATGDTAATTRRKELKHEEHAV